MCSINWTKSRGHILFCKILSKRSPWALKDEEPCLFYCKDTLQMLTCMEQSLNMDFKLHVILKTIIACYIQCLLRSQREKGQNLLE